MSQDEKVEMLEQALTTALMQAATYRERAFAMMRRCRQLRLEIGAHERDAIYWWDQYQQIRQHNG